MEIFQHIYEGMIIAFIVFVGQDYLRFRFNPPYQTKTACDDCRLACSRFQEERSAKIDALSKVVNDRMDRLEKLVMKSLDIEV